MDSHRWSWVTYAKRPFNAVYYVCKEGTTQGGAVWYMDYTIHALWRAGCKLNNSIALALRIEAYPVGNKLHPLDVSHRIRLRKSDV